MPPGRRQRFERKKVDKRTLIVREYILKNPHATVKQVCAATGAKTRSVYYVRQDLIAQQLITPAAVKRGRPPLNADAPTADVDTLETVSAADLMKQVEDITGEEYDNLTPEQMKRILSRIAGNAMMPPQVRIMAITAKNKLDFETQDRHDLGPGKPLTYAQALQRVVWMLEAIGPKMLEEAITIAFSPKGTAHAPEAESPVVGEAGTETTPPAVEPEGQPPNPPAS